MTSAAPSTTGRIVVGIDGSSSSLAALTWALAHAELIGAQVEAVTAWQDTSIGHFDYGYDLAPPPPNDEHRAGLTQQSLDQAIHTFAHDLMSTVAVSIRAQEGHPARVLPQAARGALMLVAGHRATTPSRHSCSGPSASAASSAPPAPS